MAHGRSSASCSAASMRAGACSSPATPASRGSWLALWLQAMGADVCGLALPAAAGLSHHRLLAPALDEALIDLRNAALVRSALQRFQPEFVFHLAAQALVRRSYREPAATFDTNVMGLVNLLEAVRATPSVRVVVNATSDKCYLNRETGDGYREADALGGHDPYSASKACAEIVSASYRSSFVADDGRGHGGGAGHRARRQRDRRRRLGRGPPDPRPRALGRQRRGHVDPLPAGDAPWQHVLEPLAGYLLLGRAPVADPRLAAEAWNFGPDASGQLSVAEVIDRFRAQMAGGALRRRTRAAAARSRRCCTSIAARRVSASAGGRYGTRTPPSSAPRSGIAASTSRAGCAAATIWRSTWAMRALRVWRGRRPWRPGTAPAPHEVSRHAHPRPVGGRDRAARRRPRQPDAPVLRRGLRGGDARPALRPGQSLDHRAARHGARPALPARAGARKRS